MGSHYSLIFAKLTSVIRQTWDFFQTFVSSSVSERPRTTVRVRLLCPDRQCCCHSAASAFRQPSAACSTSLPSQHLRLPCLFSRRPHSLELSPEFHPGPDHQCRVFQTFA